MRTAGATTARTAARRLRSSRQVVISRVAPAATRGSGAVEGRLVAVGQGRGSLAALDPDVIARPRRARDFSAAVPPQCVEDDLLDICPGDARGVELAAGWVDAEGDACAVGAEREPAASNQNDVRQHGGSADHNNDQRMEPDDADHTENDVDDRGRNVLAGQPVAFLVAAGVWGHCIMMHPPGGFCQHQFAAGYQDEARGADAAITDAIGSCGVRAGQGRR